MLLSSQKRDQSVSISGGDLAVLVLTLRNTEKLNTSLNSTLKKKISLGILERNQKKINKTAYKDWVRKNLVKYILTFIRNMLWTKYLLKLHCKKLHLKIRTPVI
jgi:hypothetical protein